MSDTAQHPWFFRSATNLRRDRRGSAAIGFAVAAPTFLAASFAGAMLLQRFGGPEPVVQAAERATELVSLYSRLYDSDFNETLFPITQGVAGKDEAGRPLACGIVITGLDPAPAGGARTVKWQRRYGECPDSRLTTEAKLDAPANAPVVVVEVVSGPTHGNRYAVAVAVPQKLALPAIVPGSRY